MTKRERHRKHSTSFVLTALLITACPATFAADAEKATAAPVELTAAAQSLGNEPTKSVNKTASKPAPAKPGTGNAKPATATAKPATGSAASKSPSAKDPATKRYEDLNKDDDKAKAAKQPGAIKAKAAKKTPTMLVPPPPPTIPTYLNVSPGSAFDLGMGFSVPALSLDDLKFQKKNVEKKLEAAKADEKDVKRMSDERQERADRFVSLFEEGVVSRKELETAKEEAERAARKIEQSHINVAEADRLLNQINERIKAIEAAKKPPAAPTKKTKRR